MTDSLALPDDDGTRGLAVAKPENDDQLTHIAVGLNTYTVLLSGRDTAGEHAIVDMLIPPGGGPPPHRHDFEETFYILDGEIAVMLRDDDPVTAHAGATVNVPANAPHWFANRSDRPARVLLIVAPAGLEEYFVAIGDSVPTRTSPAPTLTAAEQQERRQRSIELESAYRIENLGFPPENETT